MSYKSHLPRYRKQKTKKCHREDKRMGGCAVCYPWLDKKWRIQRNTRRDIQIKTTIKEQGKEE